MRDTAPKKKRQDAKFWVDLVSCFLIPAYTLLFAGSVEWLGTNFSVLAVTGRDHYRGFVLWGLLAGGFFLVMAFQIAKTYWMPGIRRALRLLALAACACLACAVTMPYLPDFFPRVAWLHVMWAFAACVLMMLAILLAAACAWREDHRRFAPLLAAWLGIVLGSALLFAAAGMVSSALEVFFTISASLLVRQLWLRRRG